jgi:PAS domain S-box-containing protein
VGHYTVEKRYLHPDGRVQWAELSSRFLPGTVKGRNWIITTLTDIGQRKAAEAALRQSEEQLAHAMDQAQLAYWEMDAATGAFTFNDRFYTLYGTTAEREGGYQMTAEVYAREFLPPEDCHIVPESVAKMLSGVASEDQLQHRIRRRDGEIREIVVRIAVLHDAAGRVSGTRGSNQDVTELKHRETQHQEALARLQKIASRVPGMVYQFRLFPDGRSCFPFASDAIREIYRIAPEEVVTDATKVFSLLHPEDYDGIVASIQQSARDLTHWNLDYRVKHSDGTVRWLAGNAMPEREATGAVLWHGFITDITERKTMEMQLLQAQRMEAIGALAGGVAHDLNNILSPIVMMTGLLEGRLENERDREVLAMSHSSALRGAEIIRQLLTYSRGQPVERRLVQPSHLINELVKMMSETFPRDIDLRTELPPDLWPIHADPTQLHQVLMNLCVNSRDAMPGGGHLTLHAANTSLTKGETPLPPHAQPGPYVAITVSDTGHGISPEVRHKIFDPFFTTKPVGKGTGLGLSTAIGIMRNHGGFVDFESTPAQGTSFRIYFPALPDATTAPDGATRATSTPSGNGRTILVVDDELSIRESVRLILEKERFQVVLASHGKEAIAKYLQGRDGICLVLTDLMMPVMNGVALTRALREMNPTLPIMAMSGLSKMDGAQELGALGVPGVLAKPFDGPTLLEAVHRRLAETIA